MTDKDIYLLDEDASDTEDNISEFVVEKEFGGCRLDCFLSDRLEVSRSAAVRLIDDGQVNIISATAKYKSNMTKNTRLDVGDKVCVCTKKDAELADADLTPEDIPLDIIYEDKDILVINKPASMVVHPAPGNYTGTLCNALMFHCGDELSGIGGVRRPGIVHRIDKDTSGLLVVAKNDAAHIFLSEQLKTHTVSRIYYAICLGNIKEDSLTVNKPIGRNPRDRKKMAVYPDGTDAVGVRNAITHVKVLARYPAAFGEQSLTLIRCQLETGRTHQIRVHLASIGHPLLGDSTYGGDGTTFEKKHKAHICGQVLHAKELSLIHPRTKTTMHFESPLPKDFERLLEILNSRI